MDELIVCIATTDQTVLDRWQFAFRQQGWQTHPYVLDGNGNGRPAQCRPELDLVEVGTPACKTPEDLKHLIKKLKPLAMLVFAAPQSLSNSQIAGFLECGADDFVFKNLDERILVAKLKAHIRRLDKSAFPQAPRVISRCGDIEIDRSKRVVKIKAKPGKCTELADLTQKEFDILSLLVGNEKRVVSRESMLERLWGNNATEVYSECVDKHIESLRRKLGFFGKKIRTIYGTGYMFCGGGK